MRGYSSIVTELRIMCAQDADVLETTWPFLIPYPERHLLQYLKQNYSGHQLAKDMNVAEYMNNLK